MPNCSQAFFFLLQSEKKDKPIIKQLLWGFSQNPPHKGRNGFPTENKKQTKKREKREQHGASLSRRGVVCFFGSRLRFSSSSAVIEFDGLIASLDGSAQAFTASHVRMAVAANHVSPLGRCYATVNKLQ